MLRTKLVGPLLQRCFYIFQQINYKKLRKSQTEAQAEEQKQTTNKSSSPRVYQICIKFISQQIRQLERDIHTLTHTPTRCQATSLCYAKQRKHTAVARVNFKDT